MIAPWLPPEERGKTAADWQKLGASLARAGETVRQAGLKVLWHNHDFEYLPLPDGSRPIDHLLAAAGEGVGFDWPGQDWSIVALIVAYLADPKTRADGIKIMAARAGVTPEDYTAFMGGTKLLTLAEGAKVIAAKTAGFGSVAGSAKIADEFNVKNEVYKEAQDVASYIDASLQVQAAGK